ncbi:MAG: hypothetical protein OEY69_00050 [Candidatus Krumholzibacteria bacterium]|nr:hypothetical protein [Candidatus Krumholzibacteria bacterium]
MTLPLFSDDLSKPAVDPIRNELEKKYRLWLHEHQKVFVLFEKFALQMLQMKRRFGIGALTERVRWEVRTTWGEDADGYKINNNFRAYLARDLIAKYPKLEELIETRKIREEDEGASDGEITF